MTSPSRWHRPQNVDTPSKIPSPWAKRGDDELLPPKPADPSHGAPQTPASLLPTPKRRGVQCCPTCKRGRVRLQLLVASPESASAMFCECFALDRDDGVVSLGNGVEIEFVQSRVRIQPPLKLSLWTRHRDGVCARMALHGWRKTDSAFAMEHSDLGLIVSLVEDDSAHNITL